MPPIFEFLCPDEHVTEAFVQKPADKAAPWPPAGWRCGTCGETANRIPSLPSPPEIRFPARWHWGIGAKVSSTSEVNRIAKEKDLVHIGRDHGG